jgi:hypothetical protein
VHPAGFLIRLLFSNEGGADMFLWIVCWLPTDYTTIYLRRQNSMFHVVCSETRYTHRSGFYSNFTLYKPKLDELKYKSPRYTHTHTFVEAEAIRIIDWRRLWTSSLKCTQKLSKCTAIDTSIVFRKRNVHHDSENEQFLLLVKICAHGFNSGISKSGILGNVREDGQCSFKIIFRNLTENTKKQ